MIKDEIKITPKIKTQVMKDWLAQFLSFKKSSTCSMDKIVGPVNLSIGFDVSYGVDMKFMFSLFNLANPLSHQCANLSIRPKSRRDILTVRQHEKGLYLEAVEEIKQLVPFSLDGEIKLSEILNAYYTYKGSIYSSRHYEDPALIATWAGCPKAAMQAFEWAYENLKPEEPGKVTRLRLGKDGITFDDWVRTMKEKISNPEVLRQTVEDQIVHHKLTKMPRYDLIMDLD